MNLHSLHAERLESLKTFKIFKITKLITTDHKWQPLKSVKRDLLLINDDLSKLDTHVLKVLKE